MNFTHKRFQVNEWSADKTILNPHLNPEVQYFSFKIKDYTGWQTGVIKPLIQGLPLMAAIKWSYIIRKDLREIFVYTATDEFFVDIDKGEPNSEKIDTTIKESFQRFEKEFNDKKDTLGIKDSLPVLSASVRSQIRQELLLKLK